MDKKTNNLKSCCVVNKSKRDCNCYNFTKNFKYIFIAKIKVMTKLNKKAYQISKLKQKRLLLIAKCVSQLSSLRKFNLIRITMKIEQFVILKNAISLFLSLKNK